MTMNRGNELLKVKLILSPVMICQNGFLNDSLKSEL